MWMLWGTVCTSLLLAWFLVRRWQKGRKLSRLGKRTPVSITWLTGQFSDLEVDVAVVEDLLREVASCAEVPVELLRPEDRFEEELRPLWWEFGEGVIELNWSAKHRERESGVHVDLGKIKTVADYVRKFAPLEASLRSRHN